MNVLIVESDYEARDNIIEAFKIYLPDCRLVTTDSGKKCLDIVKDQCPDIVMLGLELADMSGFDVIEQIRGCSEVPIMVLSHKRDEPRMAKAFDMGVDGYMVKPFHNLELVARVRSLIRRGKAK